MVKLEWDDLEILDFHILLESLTTNGPNIEGNSQFKFSLRNFRFGVHHHRTEFQFENEEFATVESRSLYHLYQNQKESLFLAR